MKMVLIRDVKAPAFTLGRLTCGDLRFYTVEDAVRDVKIPAITAIRAGTYKVIINYSNRFKKHLPLLLDVPEFKGVRIHSGNTAADSEGCILIGTTRNKDGVGNSRVAMDVLMEALSKHIAGGGNVTIEIV